MNKHNTDFYVEKYKEITNYALDKGLEVPYRNLTEFINDYEAIRASGSKRVMAELKYYAQYETSYETARAMLAQTKEMGDPMKLKELKSMSTRAFAEKYSEQIKAAYKEAKKMFGSSDAAALYIGRVWYGSE